MIESSMFGGCACGAVRFKCDGKAVMEAHCHCRDCQRSSGAAMATFFAIPKQGFTVLHGNTSNYSYTGNSGQPVVRHFCPTCGAPLFTDVAVMPDLQFVRAASLDEPERIKPNMHIYCVSAQPWGDWEDGLPHFRKLPG